MQLREYIYSFPRGLRMKAREILAKEVGVTSTTIKSWENGTRVISPKYVPMVEKVTEGKVTREDLRPDIGAHIYAELGIG